MARITLRASSSCGKGERVCDCFSRVCVVCWPWPRRSWRCRSRPPRRPRPPRRDAPGTQTPPPSQTKPPPSIRPRSRPRRPSRLAEDTRSLFAPTWNMFQLSGRVSSISGDPARWQRYQDLRRRAAVHRRDACCMKRPTGTAASAPTTSAGATSVTSAATNGSASSKSTDSLTRSRSSTASIPAPRSSRAGDGVLLLDDNAQRAANLNAYLPISPQFDLRESRKIGTFRVSATPTTHLDVTGGFTTTKHSGELPWGASFGFSNDNEVALPYRSRTNDVDMGLQWTNNKAMFRAGYNGSWFNNEADTLTWDNPLVLTDSTSASGHGRMALWPSNSLQTLSAAGYAKFARRTQLTGSLAFGWCEQRRAAAAVHDQQCAAAVRAAARDGRRVGDHRCHEHQPGVAPGQRLAFQHAVPPLRLQQRHARDADSTVHQLRHVGQRQLDGRSGARRARSQYVRRRRHVDRASVRRPSRSRTRTTTTATTIASSSRPTRTCCSSRQTRPVSGG